MVFQRFNLLPHMTISENCTIAPRKSRKSRALGKAEAEERAMHCLTKVRIPVSFPAASSSTSPSRGRCACSRG